MARRKESSAQNLVRFFVRSGRLKAERRRGWVKKLGLTNPESVADHSYRTALMTMVISDSRGLDTGRALRLALLHDLPEAVVGDAMPEERSGKRKTAVETEAMEELLSKLPPDLRSLYRDAWLEFVEGTSEEATTGQTARQAGDGDSSLGVCPRVERPRLGEGVLGHRKRASERRGALGNPPAGRVLRPDHRPTVCFPYLTFTSSAGMNSLS